MVRYGVALAILLACSSSLASASLSDILLQDMKSNHSQSFKDLLTRWEVKYGTDAYAALTKIARDRSLEDSERYIAIMGMAKIGGASLAPSLTAFLNDPSWMVRNAALKALSVLKNPATSPSVLPLLKDRALVIRMEAVDAAEKLKPEGFQEACAETLQDPKNYFRGKAQWVPQKVLGVLKRNSPSDAATRKKVSLELISVAKNPKDPAIEPILLLTLERVSGKSIDVKRPLNQALAQIESDIRK